MPLGIRPTVDFAFKLLMGSPEHTSITVHFLNAVLGGNPPITRVTILNPILAKENDEDKFAVLDVRAEDDAGRQLNIEMQTSLPTGLKQRLVYYASYLYVDQLKEGDGYERLRPAISICVLERALFPQRPQLHLDFQLREPQGDLLTDELQIHLVELSKSEATAHNLSVVSPLERWAFFLRHAELLNADQVRELLPEPAFDEAVGVLEMIVRTPEQEARYQARLKFQRDETARLEHARAEGIREGEQIGQAIGEQIGLARGEQIGQARGEQIGLARGEQIGQARGEQIGLARGEQIGQERGEQIGQIRLLEQLLGLSPMNPEELARSTTEQLAARVADLQQRFRDRNS